MRDGLTGQPSECGRVAGHGGARGYPSHVSLAASEHARARTAAGVADRLSRESICGNRGCEQTAPVGYMQCVEHARAANRARHRRHMDKLIQRLGGVCVRCGSANQLEFDHRDWRTKMDDIGNLVGRSAPGVIDAELAKCQLLCKPCHKAKTKRDKAEQAAERKAAKEAA